MSRLLDELTGLGKDQEIRISIEEGREGQMMSVSASECSPFMRRSKHTRTIKFYLDELEGDDELADVVSLALQRAAAAREQGQ